MCPDENGPIFHSEYTIEPNDMSCEVGKTYHCEEVMVDSDCIISYSFHYCD